MSTKEDTKAPVKYKSQSGILAEQERIKMIDYLISQRHPELMKSRKASDKSFVQNLREEFEELWDVQVMTMCQGEKMREELHRKRYIEALFIWDNPEYETYQWSIMAQWSIKEANLLAFDKNPEDIFLDDTDIPITTILYDHPDIGLFREYEKIVERAVKQGILTDPVVPIDYVKWVKQNTIRFPKDLAELVYKHSDETDWKAKHEELAEQHKKLEKKYSKLETQLQEAQLETKPSALKNQQKSLLRIILGIALEKYDYKPGKTKNAATKQIVNDLQLHGIKVSQDTVKKYLDLAQEELPDSYMLEADCSL